MIPLFLRAHEFGICMLEDRVDSGLELHGVDYQEPALMVTVSKAKGHSLRELIHLVIQNEAFLTK